MILRTPFALFSAAIACLLLPMPYVYFNSDSAIVAFMGADILQHGYLPAYFYGQSYFLSFTPYAFALGKAAFGWLGLGDVALFKTAGLAVSLAGLWLLYETALIKASTRQDALLAGSIFILIFASFPSAALRMYDSSQAEQYYFCFGLVIFSLARLQQAIENEEPSLYRWWALLGFALLYSFHSRLQAVIFGLFGVSAILLSAGKRPVRKDALFLALGAVAGSFLYILHLAAYRGHWPFSSGGPSRALGSGEKIIAQLQMTLGGIVPHLFEWSFNQPLHSALSFLLVLLALYAGAFLFAPPFARVSLAFIGLALRKTPRGLRYAFALLFAAVGFLHALGAIYYLAIGPFDGTLLGLHITLNDPAKPIFIAFVAGIFALALAWPPSFSRHADEKYPAVETSLLFGSCVLVILMILVKDLGGDIGSARYVAVFPAAAALMLARWAISLPPIQQKALTALALASFAVSIPQWRDMLEWERQRNAEFAGDLAAIKPLADKAPVIWADYWDAYALAFAGGENPLLEAYPYQKVRRYGRVSQETARAGLWLAREDQLDALAKEARAAAGQDELQIILRLTLHGNVPYVLLRFTGVETAERMMARHHPLYFKTAYPPGS